MMNLKKIKECPECGGTDLWGPEYDFLAQGCFQCGYIHGLIQTQDMSKLPKLSKKEKRKRRKA
jgi:hypothetical protein